MKEDLNGNICSCGKKIYTSYKKAATSMNCVKAHHETAKTKINKRAYLSKECMFPGSPEIWHLTSQLRN